jgi:hypothetical protein
LIQVALILQATTHSGALAGSQVLVSAFATFQQAQPGNILFFPEKIEYLFHFYLLSCLLSINCFFG